MSRYVSSSLLWRFVAVSHPFSCDVSSLESNFSGYTSSVQDRDQFLELFHGTEALFTVSSLLVAEFQFVLFHHHISEFRWSISVLERFLLVLRDVEAQDAGDKWARLCCSLSSILELLFRSHFSYMTEEDQIKLVHVAYMAQYEPIEAKMEAHIVWLVSQLESPHRAPLLTYRLLMHLDQLLETHSYNSTKLVHLVNYYLVHERFQIAAAAQQLLSTLLLPLHLPLRPSLVSANAVEFSIESFLDIMEKSQTQPGEVQAMRETLRTLSSIHSAFPERTLPFINDICLSLYAIVQKRPECAQLAMQALASLTDPTTLQSLDSVVLCQFIEETILRYMDQKEIVGLIFTLARNATGGLEVESLISLCKSLQQSHPTVRHLLLDYLSHNPSVAESSELGDTREVVMMIFQCYSSLLQVVPGGCLSFLNEICMQLMREQAAEIAMHEEVTIVFVETLVEVCRARVLLPWLVSSLRNDHLLLFISKCESFNVKPGVVQRALVSLLCACFSSDSGEETDEIHWARAFSDETIDGGPLSNGNVQIRGMAWSIESESRFFTVLDLLYLSLVCCDFQVVSYILDSSVAFGRASADSPWQERLKMAMMEVLDEDLVYRLSPPQLVRVATIWSHCFSYTASQPSCSANQMLLSAIASLKLDFDMLLPTRFYTLETFADLVPNTFIKWIWDHLQGSLIVASLHLMKSLGSNSSGLSRACLSSCLSHAKCVKLLVDTYISNAVSNPIITPMQALTLLSRELSVSRSRNDQSTENDGNAFLGTTKSHLARLLLSSAFPLAIPQEWSKSISLVAIELHLGISLQLLLCDLEKHDSLYVFSGNAKARQETFSRYWRCIETVSFSVQRHVNELLSSSIDHTMDISTFFERVDAITLALLNMWNTLMARFEFSSDLAKRLLGTPSIGRIWSAFRYSSETSSRNVQQIIAMVSRAKATRRLALPAQHGISGPSIPPPSTSVLNAIMISVYHLTKIESHVQPSQSVTSRTSQLLRHLKQLTTDNPLTKLINISCIGSLLQILSQYHLVNGSNADSFQAELRLAFLTTCSSLLSTNSSSPHHLISESSAVALIRATSMVTDPNWLRLPQVSVLLSTVLQCTSSPSSLSTSMSLVILSIVLTSSRLKPTEIPKPVLAQLLSPRLVRILLLSEDLTRFRINMLTLYTMMKCGMWKSVLKRDGRHGPFLINSLSSQLTELSSFSPPSDKRSSLPPLGIVDLSGVFVSESMVNLECDLKQILPVPRSAKCLKTWLDYVSI